MDVRIHGIYFFSTTDKNDCNESHKLFVRHVSFVIYYRRIYSRGDKHDPQITKLLKEITRNSF